MQSDLWEEQRFKVYAPMGSHVNEIEKKILKKWKMHLCLKKIKTEATTEIGKKSAEQALK